MFTRANRSSSNSMPSWMNSPTGETPPTSARTRGGKYGGRAHSSSFGDPGQPSWMFETTPRAAPSGSTGSGEADPLLPNKETYVDIGLTRRQFKGPMGKRYSSDMLCLIFFVVYMVGMVALGVVAFVQDGLSDKVIYLTEGVDFQGRGCGADGGVYFPHWQTLPDFGVCVSTCPKKGELVHALLPIVPPGNASVEETVGTQSMSNRTTREVTFTGYDSVMNGYVCAPVEAIDSVSADTTQLNDVLGLYIGAIRLNWEAILYACGVGLGLAIVYLVFLRFGGCLVLSLSVVAIQVALIAGAVFLWLLSEKQEYDRRTQNLFLILAVTLVCGAMAYFLAVVIMVQRLMLAGKYIVFATKVFSQMNKMVLIPLFYAFLLVGALAWGLAVTVCLFTAGKTTLVKESIPVNDATETVDVLVRAFQRDVTLRWFFVYHAFGMYWLINVLLALVDMSVAMSVGVWYFTPTDRQTKKKAFEIADPVKYSMSSILEYHVGTAAFSALVVAPVRYIRNLFMYIDDHKDPEAAGSVFAQVFSTLCCCCIWCFNQFIVFICKESYFITAIEGTSFYSAAKVAHGLISSHFLRIGAINRIGNASVLLGKVIVCSATSFIAWSFMADTSSASSTVVPMVVIVLISYAIAHTFMTLYETTINVLLLSFALDEAIHGGRGRSEFAESDLIKSVNDNLRPKWQTVL